MSKALDLQKEVVITKRHIEPDSDGKYTLSLDEWSRWGKDNRLPLHILDKVTQDPVSKRALEFKTDAHYGKGYQLYRKLYSNGKKILEPVDITQFPEIDEFFYSNNIPNFLQSIVQDYEYWHRYHVQYILNGSRSKIIQVNSGIGEPGSAYFLRTKDIRKKKRTKDTRIMEGFYISPDWTEASPETDFIPAFNIRDPFRLASGMYEHKRPGIGNDYYITPGWFSSIIWLEVTSRIPKWISSNIKNSINLKYHIQYPEDYFTTLYPRERYKSDEEWTAVLHSKEQELRAQFDEMLSGEENTNKSLWTKYELDDLGKEQPGWKIDQIQNDIKDQAWLQADQTASVRILTAHGVDPTLAGIVVSNTSAGSGSDVREKFNYHMQLKTVIGRQTTTEWFEVVKRANGWPSDLELGYESIILDSLDNNKSGFESSNEQTPTTTEKTVIN